jgi:hypothetical protein
METPAKKIARMTPTATARAGPAGRTSAVQVITRVRKLAIPVTAFRE